MIEIADLKLTRNDQHILSVDKLQLAPGERLVVLGPNGCGKSTLLRILAGLITDYSGTCQIDVSHSWRTYVHQQPFLFRGSVLQNVRYGYQTRAGQGASPMDWLQRMGLGKMAHRSTENLSGGEIRRIALARALATHPKLLILDEPLAELDPTSAQTVCRVLNELSDTTVIIASPVDPPPELKSQQFTIQHASPSPC
ncbi:MAG: hypothetical protein CMJ72_08560 [Planctomycetaceae bacterium]|nr:hypothetical protein [Planctomycetaceae bacterium]